MIIEMEIADDIDLNDNETDISDFDTSDLPTETPERIAKALGKLVEMYEGLENDLALRIKALSAVGLTFDVLNDGPFIVDRANAVAGHARLLAEFDEDHAAAK